MKPLRVALSGCGFRLPAHVGALQAIVDAGYNVTEMAGTSGGALIAALYASGMSLDEMQDICMEMDWSPMMGLSAGSILRARGLCSGRNLLAFMMQRTGRIVFGELDIDLRIIAASLATEQEFVFDRRHTPDMPIALAARASASIPVVYEPVRVGEHELVDGGTTDNIPASNLTVDAVPRLGIYLEAKDGPLGPRRRIWDLAPRIIDLMLASNESARLALDESGGASIVRVQTGYASSFDRHMPRTTRERLYDDGYAATAAALKGLSGDVDGPARQG